MKCLVLFYFPNREILSCDLLLSVVRELEAIFLGGEAMGRLISGFHRAFLKSVTFYWPTNALNCMKLRG